MVIISFLKVFTSVKNLTEMVSKSEIFQVRKNITITIIIMINLEGRVPLYLLIQQGKNNVKSS